MYNKLVHHLSILALIIISFTFNAFGQKKLSSENPKAVSSFQKAIQLYDYRENEKALEFLDDALKADSNFIEAHMLRANIFSDIKIFPKAIESYKKAISINPDFFPNNYYSLAKAEFLSGNYTDAREHYDKFLSYDKLNMNLKTTAQQMLQNCAFAEQAIKNPIPFNPINMGDSINSIDDEYFPSITADGKTLLITRNINSSGRMGKITPQEDFYISKLNNGKWSLASPISEINTRGNEGAPTLSADGQYLFFTACANQDPNSNARKTKGRCDLFISKKVGDKFNEPRNLGEPVNSSTWESQPSFSSDGRTLYFVRAVYDNSGRSQKDIFVTHISDKSEWSEPVPLSNKINTPDDESSVFIHPDDQTLYFASDGHPGMGDLDIFMSKRDANGEWGDPVNLGYPINTSGEESSLLVGPTGEVAYFASNRDGGRGGLDLYQFSLPAMMRPSPVTYMKGKVFDADTKNVLGAGFELIDLSTGKMIVSSTSNPGNGEFLVCLPTGKSYALNVSKDGYLFYSENFQLKDPKSAHDPVMKDIPLQPIKVGSSVILKNIFYDFDKFDLKNESRIELNKLVGFLQKNTKVKIEISGHTDNVGGKQYNQQLSEKRSKSVFDFLVQNSIAADRITFKGYGDSKPVADNATEQGRAQNRRTEFLITSSK